MSEIYLHFRESVCIFSTITIHNYAMIWSSYSVLINGLILSTINDTKSGQVDSQAIFKSQLQVRIADVWIINEPIYGYLSSFIF